MSSESSQKKPENDSSAAELFQNPNRALADDMDQLAAQVVGAAFDNDDDLRALLDGMEKLAAMEPTDASFQQQVGEAIQCLHKALQLSPQKRRAPMNRLNRIIEAIQQILHAPDENNPVQPGAQKNPAPNVVEDDPPEDEEEADASLFLEPDILSQYILESLEHFQMVEAKLLDMENQPEDPEMLNAIFRAFHSTKGTASFLGLKDIKNLAHQAETMLELVRGGAIRLQGAVVDLALEATDTLRTMIKALQPMAQGQGKSIPPPPPQYASILQRLGEIGKKAESLESPALTPESPETDVALDAAEPPPDPATGSVKKSTPELSEHTVRVNLGRMDNLINLVGELVIVHAMIAQDAFLRSEPGRVLARNVSQLGKISRDLQDLSMSMRMVPLKPTFQKVERAARDLARKSGKTIRFLTEGEDTEIDRNLVEGLNDPLVHLIRNAVDHGIESQSERRAANKSAEGTIVLHAYHAAGNVVIEIRDDGRGLDLDRLCRLGVERGLIPAEKDCSEDEIMKLIFEPGISTAARVTEYSGRGVGMDVVKKNIEAVHGRVEVNSVPGFGSAFTLRIPLTLAIIDGLIMHVGNQQYIIPTLNVTHALRPTASQLSTVQGKGEMLNLRNQLIPVFRLHRLFGVAHAVEDPTQGMLLVVGYETRECALLIDSIVGQQQVVIKTLGEGLGKLTGIAGAAILGDGRIRMILDIAGVMELAYKRTQEAVVVTS